MRAQEIMRNHLLMILPPGREGLEHYRVFSDPDLKFTINFSGGASSGYMLAHILAAYDYQLPDNVVVVFCNTGAEREETFRYVEDYALHFGIKIWWLEYRFNKDGTGRPGNYKHHYEIVNHNSASRNYEPFEQLILAKSMLPNPVMRFCTTELKVRTVQRFCRRELGWKTKDILNIIGYRYDEPKRWSKKLWDDCVQRFPMVPARVEKHDVAMFWRRMPFRLAIERATRATATCVS